eukprot:11777576-Alexandrium_andersonii.AAC.1
MSSREPRTSATSGPPSAAGASPTPFCRTPCRSGRPWSETSTPAGQRAPPGLRTALSRRGCTPSGARPARPRAGLRSGRSSCVHRPVPP